MAAFKDNAGVEWNVTIDYSTIMRIRQDCDPQFMIGDDGENNTFTRLEQDPALLCRVIYLACEKQRTTRGVDDETFYLNVMGPAIEGASSALLQAMLFFTPPRVRAMVEAQAKVREAGVAKVMARLNDPRFEETMMAALDSKLDDLLGNL